jgi:hypothetical protein
VAKRGHPARQPISADSMSKRRRPPRACLPSAAPEPQGLAGAVYGYSRRSLPHSRGLPGKPATRAVRSRTASCRHTECVMFGTV